MSAMVLEQPTLIEKSHSIARGCALWLFIFILAWAPFPLGGSIPWAAGVQEIAVALSCALWLYGTRLMPLQNETLNVWLLTPLVLAVASVCWAVVQIVPGVPADWVHPVWSMAGDILGTKLAGTISINPWRTETEIIKLVSYLAAASLVFCMARRSENAKLLLNAVIIIGTAYALYGFGLKFTNLQQTQVFYAVPFRSPLMSGPFMLHNSFATYSGLAAVAAMAKLFTEGSSSVVTGRDWRRFVASLLQYCLGRGAPLILASLVTFAAVVASASRAGTASTLIGLIVLALVSLLAVNDGKSRLWRGLGAVLATSPIIVLIVMNGDTLGSRLDRLLASDTADAVRFNLWDAAQHMISTAPWLGLGLGTFEDAYPMFATNVYPLVMDKAHCDYLEFAAGIGLPAAIAFWAAIAGAAVLCLVGVRIRRRRRIYPAIAVAATALVGVHACVDFSLQIPAVALSYATLLAMGLAQCRSSER